MTAWPRAPAPSRPTLLLLGALAALVTFEARFALRPPPALSPELMANAVVLDLTVAGSLLVWWFGVRPGRLPRILLPLTFLGALGLSRLLVGEHDPLSLRLLGAVAIAAEVGLFVLALRAVTLAAREVGREGGDPLRAIRARVSAVLGTGLGARLVASELAALWCATAGWFHAPRSYAEAGRTFSYGRHDGALYAAILGVGVVELGAVHLLVGLWSHGAAWALTALSAYGLLWIAGDWRASRLRPLAVLPDRVVLRSGLRWTAEIPRTRIRGVVQPRGTPRFGGGDGELDLALFGGPALVVELTEPVEVEGPFGIRRSALRLGVPADDPEGLRAALEDPAAS